MSPRSTSSSPVGAYETKTVGQILRESVVPSLSLAIPAFVITTIVSIAVGLISAYFRGTLIDRGARTLIVSLG